MSRFCGQDVLFVISVGGGDIARQISGNIVSAVNHAKMIDGIVLGIIGRDGGFTATQAKACIVVPCKYPEWTTPVVEGVQSVLLHLLVTHPELALSKPKWECEMKMEPESAT